MASYGYDRMRMSLFFNLLFSIFNGFYLAHCLLTSKTPHSTLPTTEKKTSFIFLLYYLPYHSHISEYLIQLEIKIHRCRSANIMCFFVSFSCIWICSVALCRLFNIDFFTVENVCIASIINWHAIHLFWLEYKRFMYNIYRATITCNIRRVNFLHGKNSWRTIVFYQFDNYFRSNGFVKFRVKTFPILYLINFHAITSISIYHDLIFSI